MTFFLIAVSLVAVVLIVTRTEAVSVKRLLLVLIGISVAATLARGDIVGAVVMALTLVVSVVVGRQIVKRCKKMGPL